jgi:putative nucleotidyltransferase with HDIG domain
MKRILFVDDEQEFLEGLRRALEPQELQWKIAFAPSGNSALDLLSKESFDVIVSGIRMPEMDGAALLKIVCERFPAIVRIVVCSQEEMNGALRAVPVAHQFLLKPCDPHMLRVAVERATSLSDVLSNKLLASIIGSVKDLPVSPRTFAALRERLADPEASVKDVVKLVEQDVAISAKILQLVNSAFFGLPREISTLNTAVSFLGVDMLQNLVLSAEVFRVFENTALPGFSFEELHQHSQLTAKIASHIPMPAAVHSAAVVAGLLHDVGKLVLATRSPKHFVRAIEGAAEEKRPLFDVEHELMGVSHAEVGAYLLGIWGLPCPVVEAVAHHHHPERVPQDTLDAVTVVHLANYLAHENPVQTATDDDSNSYLKPDPDYLENLGLTEQIPSWNEFAASAAAEMRGGPKREASSRATETAKR